MTRRDDENVRIDPYTTTKRTSMKMKLKRSYKLRDGAQIPTRPATFEEIMSDPRFAQGVADARAGRPFPADFDVWEHGNDQWCYERGRQWATLAPRNVKLKANGRISQQALRWYGEDIL